MNKRLFFKLVFYITGTFITLMMVAIVVLNFARDARIVRKPALTVEDANTSKAPAGSAEDKGEDFGTIKYDKQKGTGSGTSGKVEKSSGASGKDAAGEPKTEPKTQPKTERIKVEVINYTGIEGLAANMVETLRTSGFEASGRDERPDPSMTTLVIERNDSNAGKAVQEVIKAGRVVKWPDSKSVFDVTIKIGNDYKP